MDKLFSMIAEWFAMTVIEIATKFARTQMHIRFVHDNGGWHKLSIHDAGIRVVPESLFQHFVHDVVRVSFDRGIIDELGNLVPNRVAVPKGWIPDRYFELVNVDGLGTGFVHMWSSVTDNVYELLGERVFGHKMSFDYDKYAMKIQNYFHCGFMTSIGILKGRIAVVKGLHNDGFSFVLRNDLPEEMDDASSFKVSTCVVDVDGKLAVMKGVVGIIDSFENLVAYLRDRSKEGLVYDAALVSKVWAMLHQGGIVFVCGDNEIKCSKEYEYSFPYSCVFGVKGYDSEACFWKSHIQLSGQNAMWSAHVIMPELFGNHAKNLVETVKTREGFFSLMKGPHAVALECFGHVYDTKYKGEEDDDGYSNNVLAEGSELRFKAMRKSLNRKLVRLDLPGFTTYAAAGIGLMKGQIVMGTGRYHQYLRMLEQHPELKDLFSLRQPDQGYSVAPMPEIIHDPMLPRNMVMFADWQFSMWRGDMDGDLYVIFLAMASGKPYRDALPEDSMFDAAMVEAGDMDLFDRCLAATDAKHFGWTVMQAYRALESGKEELALHIQWFLVQSQLDGIKDGSMVDARATVEMIRKKHSYNVYSDHFYHVLNNKPKGRKWKQPAKVVRSAALEAVIPYVKEFNETCFKWDIKVEKARWTEFSKLARKVGGVPGRGWRRDLEESDPVWSTILQLYTAMDYSGARKALRTHLAKLEVGVATHEYLASMARFMAKLWGTGRYYQALSNSLTEAEMRFAHAYISSSGPGSLDKFTKAMEALAGRPASDETDWTDLE